MIPYDLLNSEEAFYWSCVCRSVKSLILRDVCVYVCVSVCVRYLHSMGDKGDEYMDKVVPTVSDLCEYVQW